MMGGSFCRISILNLPHKYTGRKGRVTFGTLFEIGAIDRRYATMASRSSGVIAAKPGQSMGNGGIRVPSFMIPRVIARLISSSVQLPRPVSLSDVRFAVG